MNTPRIETAAEVRDKFAAEAHAAWQENAELRLAIANLLPYAMAAISLPRESWPTDSVILRAEALLSRKVKT